MEEVAIRKATIRKDEPTLEDELDRNQYAEAFAKLAETCETPPIPIHVIFQPE